MFYCEILSEKATEQVIQEFLISCVEGDLKMVKYYMYFYQVPFQDGYFIGTNKVKKVICKDFRRRVIINFMKGKEVYYKSKNGNIVQLKEVDYNILYDENNDFYCLAVIDNCQLENYDRWKMQQMRIAIDSQ